MKSQLQFCLLFLLFWIDWVLCDSCGMSDVTVVRRGDMVVGWRIGTHCDVLNFHEANLTKPDIRNLCNALKSFRMLRAIDLSRNYLTDRGLQPFMSCLSKFPFLESLVLAENQLSDDGIRELFPALSKHETLTTLNLSGNDLTDVTVRRLTPFLRTVPKLEHLYLHHNNISLDALNEMETSVKSLGRLSLHHNIRGLTSGSIVLENNNISSPMGAVAIDTNARKDNEEVVLDGLETSDSTAPLLFGKSNEEAVIARDLHPTTERFNENYRGMVRIPLTAIPHCEFSEDEMDSTVRPLLRALVVEEEDQTGEILDDPDGLINDVLSSWEWKIPGLLERKLRRCFTEKICLERWLNRRVRHIGSPGNSESNNENVEEAEEEFLISDELLSRCSDAYVHPAPFLESSLSSDQRWLLLSESEQNWLEKNNEEVVEEGFATSSGDEL